MLDFVLVGQSTRIALPLLQSLYSARLGTCAVVGSRGTSGLRWSRLCSEHVVIDFANDEETVQRINALARRSPQALLIPFDCEGIRLVSRLESRLALDDVRAIDLYRDNEPGLRTALGSHADAFARHISSFEFDLALALLRGRDAR